ncbi:solute carrier family 26 member 6 isoform X2 [Xenopus laevis]|uniref:Solute carrier family 26 member 6 isoform X2 n=1 Tax=Xenopus laevis TaxID=8355 RepID=A0A8J1MZ81_XENLA|nr:solute carrier family 26 member 6 isoform X2 [Xenopus laevis]
MTEEIEIELSGKSYDTKHCVFSEAELDDIAPKSQGQPSLWTWMKSHTRCSLGMGRSLLLNYIPVLRWIHRYPFKEWILGDVISGLSVGIMQLPQGLAYSLLAGLPPVFGLYTSFYPAFIYFLLGTSRHISVGTFAVVCAMTGGVTETLVPEENMLIGNNATFYDTVARDNLRVEVATALAFLVGLIQIALGLLQFGFVVIYLSDPLISGYTTASAVHVLVAQLKYLLGIKLSQKTELFSLINTLMNLSSSITETSIGTVITSLIAIVVLLIMKFLNEKLFSRFIIPIPIELILLIVSTGISYGVGLQDLFGIENVGDIPVGLKAPVLPNINYFEDIIGNAFAIAIVGYAITISLGKVFASKHGYKVDTNQELVALGCSNFIGSFFHCFATSASLSRSLVQESTGGNSQISSAVASLVIFIFILRAGELFQDLPKLIWLVTFFATILLNMVMGLAVSVAFSLLTVIFRTQVSDYSILGQVNEMGIYRDVAKYQQAKELAGIKIFHSSSSVYFANAELYMKALNRKCGMNIERLIEKRRKAIKKQKKNQEKATKKAKKEKEQPQEVTGRVNIGFDGLQLESPPNETQQTKENETVDGAVVAIPEGDANEEKVEVITLQSLGLEKPSFHSLILDFSAFNFVDTACIKVFKKIFNDFAEIEVNVFLTCCNATVMNGLEQGNFFNDTIRKSCVFNSVHDAVTHLTGDRDIFVQDEPDTHL